jgi:2,4-dienoyl-CoA reductase-like NADH-dependent reductase (Old Yellow Enzyme family)
MDRDDIQRIVKSYGEAALRCKEGGLDGCEVVGQAHLPEQFWSPAWNWRSDEFGGTLENRLRFGFMVLEEIRRKVGDDFIVGIRVAIDQNLDGGLSKDDCLEIAQIHEKSGLIDFLNLNYGRVDTEIDYINLMPGMSAPTATYLDLVREFTRELKLPTFHACRIIDAASARHAIREGIVDMIGCRLRTLANGWSLWAVARLVSRPHGCVRYAVTRSFSSRRWTVSVGKLFWQQRQNGVAKYWELQTGSVTKSITLAWMYDSRSMPNMRQ